ncbi:hypothetical protein PR202_ga29339 [Eleusine coracana subsp. coracana]|uniref:LOB domain-containing protein n=1 Tax=Eleusine coracana subsp. coracana TaxID=191504 RepID=A0AAV5DLV6_ELECO|nr:hypothetical protein QOZ80_7AG0575120 [Eleusine coracana subsp. coracana]GJN11166.1 hypothetical protein PR202_ga29339 [Eleusine coracana subsp. coracana]
MAELVEGFACMRGRGARGEWTTMSCNGCRVLRKGCSEDCVLRPCLQWLETPEAQGHATVFVAKFFGRAGLMSFLTAVPESQRPAVFQSLLYEAAGRTINPVGGAVGLLGSGSWHLCQAAVDTVLRGGGIRPMQQEVDGGAGAAGDGREPFACTARRAVGCSTFSAAKRVATKRIAVADAAPEEPPSCDLGLWLSGGPESPPAMGERRRPGTPSMNSEESVTTTSSGGGGREPELLNLFV